MMDRRGDGDGDGNVALGNIRTVYRIKKGADIHTRRHLILLINNLFFS